MRREQDDREPMERLIAMGLTDLTARAQASQLARAYGRDAEIERVAQSLLRKESVLLLGDAEVGKTAILHELVNRIVWKQPPEGMHGKRVVSISTGGVMAGTRYLGEWQTRLTDMLEAIKQDGNILFYIEDIWGLRDAGRATDEADGFATLIRPYLERHDVTLLGETTPENFVSGRHRPQGLADDLSLMKCFNAIKIEETSLEATRGILHAVARRLQRVHKARIETAAVERGIELTRRFLPYQAFPGKAVRLLEETTRPQGADERTRQGAQVAGGEVVITADLVTATFSRVTGLPEKIISDRIPLTQEEIRAYFEERVIGQDEAISAVVNVVTLVKAELHDPGRPLGVLFFVGPTGVGKTELAKTLAEYLFGSKEKLLRFDMSEYKTYRSLGDLLEQLTETQRRQSFSVLLLDEIEKAGPFVFDIFLSAFDDARLTDGLGRSVDLHNTIIVMTSNLGSDLATVRPQRGMGFVDEASEAVDAAQQRREVLDAVMRSHFRPEFINRIDKVVAFQPLGIEEMRRIARRELGKALLREGVLRRNILLDFREEVLDVLLAEGFSPTYGARPLQRAIKEVVLLPLARKIAAQPAAGEMLLELVVRDGRIEAEALPTSPEAEAERPEREPEEPRLVVRQGASGRERAMDLREIEQRIERERQRVELHMASEHYQSLQAQVHSLLEDSGQPTFWDDQERSRQTLSTIYRLEQVTDHFKDLCNRAEGLLEVANMIRVHGDVAGLRELAARYEALERDITLAELELVAGDAAAAAVDVAFVCVTPLLMPKTRDATEWAETLRAMYEAWAQRKGYEAETVSERGAPPMLVVRGANIYHILRGEDGVHKLQREAPPTSDATRRRGARATTQIQLARVEVLPGPRMGKDAPPIAAEDARVTVVDAVPDRDEREGRRKLVEACDIAHKHTVRLQAADAEHLALALLVAWRARPPKGTAMTADEELARVCYMARSQYVRDPRTNHRERRPRDVLAGAIDAFLVAYLSSERGGEVGQPTGPSDGDSAA